MLEPFYTTCPLCAAAASRPVATFPQLAFDACVHCGLVYKRYQQASVSHAYEASYFETGRSQYLKRFEHRVRKGVRQLLAAREFAPHARRVLDVGCSAGYMMQAASDLGLEGVGLDCSAFAISLCAERGLQALEGHFDAMPFADATFDIVTAKHTLEHVVDPRAALREVARVLRPGGVALIMVPDADYWKRHLLPNRGSYFRPDRAGWQHHVYYGASQLQAMAQACGLQPLHTGKAIYRRQLARGPRRAWEVLRYGLVAAGTALAAACHVRREIQLIVSPRGYRP